MPAVESDRQQFEYYRIFKGKLVTKVDEGTEGARRREWKTPAGVEGVTFEIVKEAWKGRIYGVKTKETDYGQVCEVRFEDAVITMPTNSGYFQSFAQVLKNIDLSKEIIFRPYDFTDKEGKRRIGVSVTQDGEKVKNAYTIKGEDGKYKNYHGYPMVDEKKKTKPGYWKIYFSEVEMFLCDEVAKIVFPNEIPKQITKDDLEEAGFPIIEDDVDPSKVPF